MPCECGRRALAAVKGKLKARKFHFLCGRCYRDQQNAERVKPC